MKPKGGITLIIAVGGDKSPSHGNSVKKQKNIKMITVPIDALASPDEAGEAVAPSPGDSVVLDNVEANVSDVVDGAAHLELVSVNGAPVEYGAPAPEESPEDMAMMEEELLEAAKAEDAEAGY